MIQQYFKQAWRLLKENPVLSAISIIGTALAICMIMVIVMSHQVKNAPYPPETNRDRMLYVKWMSSREKKASCFKALQIPEAVTVVSAYAPPGMVSVPGQNTAESYDKMLTDENFWQVFDFTFIDGKPYTKADVDAGLRKVVVTEKIAREAFGSTAVSGQRILIDYTEFTVSGVVRDVSTLATAAYSQMWVPITAETLPEGGSEGISGACRVFILAKNKKDFPAIKEEAEILRKKFNDGTSTYEAFYRDQPDENYHTAISHCAGAFADHSSHQSFGNDEFKDKKTPLRTRGTTGFWRYAKKSALPGDVGEPAANTVRRCFGFAFLLRRRLCPERDNL